MELVQWVVGRPDRSFALVFAPARATRLPPLGSAAAGAPDGASLRRRPGALLSSPWLPFPLAAAELAQDDAGAPSGRAAPAAPGVVAVSLALAVEGTHAPLLGRPPGEPVHAGSGDVALAGLLAEYVRCVVDLLEAAGLPLLALAPAADGGGLEILLGEVGGRSLEDVCAALGLWRVAAELTARARGLEVRAAQVAVEGLGRLEVDGALLAGLRQAGGPRPPP